MNLYLDIGTRYVPNMKTCSEHHWNQNRNKIENKFSSLQYRYLFIFDYKALFVCLFKRLDMSKNSNTSLLLQHFWINFWCPVLFTYQKNNIKMKNHLIMFEKVSMCSLKYEYISSYRQRRNIFFPEDYTLVWPEFFR